MRKITVWVLILLLCASLLPAHAQTPDMPRIACILELAAPASGGFWPTMFAGFDATAQENGVSIVYLETTHIPRVDGVRIAMLSGMDAIITSYVNEPEFLALLQAARQQGILVAFVDRDGPTQYRDLYIGLNNYQAGSDIARSAMEYMQPGGGALLMYYNHYSNLLERRRGIQETISAAGYKIYMRDATQMNTNQRQEYMEYMVQTHPDIQVIIGLFEQVSTLCAQFKLASPLLRDLPLVCFDLTDELCAYQQEGVVQDALEQDPYEIGVQCIRALSSALKGSAPVQEFIHIPYRLVHGPTASQEVKK